MPPWIPAVPLASAIALFAFVTSAMAQTDLPTSASVATNTAPAVAPRLMSLTEMADVSGGEETRIEVLTRQQLTGSTTGNTITAGSVASGNATLSNGALSGFSGVGNFVVNTGANNTLQGAINISIVTAPPGK